MKTTASTARNALLRTAFIINVIISLLVGIATEPLYGVAFLVIGVIVIQSQQLKDFSWRTVISIIGVILTMGIYTSCSPSCSESGRRQLEREKVYFSLESVGNIGDLEIYNNRFVVVARQYDITVAASDSTTPKGHFFALIITKKDLEKYDNWKKLNERMKAEYAQGKKIGKPAIYYLSPHDITKSVPIADRYESTIRWQDVHLYRTPLPANNPDSLFNPARPLRDK